MKKMTTEIHCNSLRCIYATCGILKTVECLMIYLFNQKFHHLPIEATQSTEIFKLVIFHNCAQLILADSNICSVYNYISTQK